MAPASMFWETMDYCPPAPVGEPQAPYALSDVLAEILARRTVSTARDDRAPLPPRPEGRRSAADWSPAWIAGQVAPTSVPALSG